MTDEVNLDNLDALADLPDSADTAVEADPVADAAVDSINDNAEEQPVAADGAVESGTAENDAEASGDADEQESEELDAGAKAVEEFSKSLRTLEGKWYVLHTYSGYEKRVKTNVESRVVSFGLEDKIFQIEVPMEEVDKHTDKGKKVITRVRVPGYVLIRMWPDEDARRIVRETEGVTGFVGPTKDPAPLSRKEVVAMLAPMIASEALKKAGDKPAAAKKRVVEVSYAVGDQVTVIDGPFATMAAVVSDVEPTTQKLTVLVPSSGATRRWNSASIRWRSFSKSSDVVCMNGGRFPAAFCVAGTICATTCHARTMALMASKGKPSPRSAVKPLSNAQVSRLAKRTRSSIRCTTCRPARIARSTRPKSPRRTPRAPHGCSRASMSCSAQAAGRTPGGLTTSLKPARSSPRPRM